jgi:hypothetical protein
MFDVGRSSVSFSIKPAVFLASGAAYMKRHSLRQNLQNYFFSESIYILTIQPAEAISLVDKEILINMSVFFCVSLWRITRIHTSAY